MTITRGLEGAYVVRDKGEFLTHNHAIAWMGFEKLGLLPQAFALDELMAGRLPLQREIVVVGGVGLVVEALRQLGVEAPSLDYPDALQRFLGRRMWRSTLAELRRHRDDDPPIFAKPVGHKRFVGLVVSKFRDLIGTAHLPDDEPIHLSDAVEFVAEKRYFVLDGEIVWMGHYAGDPLAQLDHEVVRAALRAWSDVPRACGLDFGLTPDGRTLLVEVNDAFALGAYGTPPMLYAQLLALRWKQLVGLAHE